MEPNLYNFKIFNSFLKLADETPLMNYPVHIKFNTGLNRLGFWHTDIPKIISSLKETTHVKVQSIFSHLAASEDLEEQDFTINQINNFAYIAQQVYKHLGYEPMLHILNTSGVINYPKAQFDMVRIGIGLYGFGNDDKETDQLKNTHNLKSIISQIHLIKPGETVGYNRAFTATRPIKSATIPIGHADGLSRRLGNKKGFVIINDQKAKIIGNVCMDVILVDVTKIDCKEGDEVIIFNNQKTIKHISDTSETIVYETLTAISQRIKKILK
jgi:alanine racemase